MSGLLVGKFKVHSPDMGWRFANGQPTQDENRTVPRALRTASLPEMVSSPITSAVGNSEAALLYIPEPK